MKTAIPWMMTLSRLLFAPIVIWLAFTQHGLALSVCIAVEVVLDILDGMVARRFNVATSTLRRADSLIDTVFYLAILYCAVKFHWYTLRRYWILLATLLLMEAGRHAFDYWKFRRESAYHMWSSKLWGLVLGVAVIALLGFNYSGWLLPSALALGILSDIEGWIISTLLLKNVEDVAHIGRAIVLRRQQQAEQEALSYAAVS